MNIKKIFIFIKKKEVNIHKKRIEEYSLIKIKEKKPLPYSVLNPETNSDSPSEKSKGERLDSAKQTINQQKKYRIKYYYKIIFNLSIIS